MPLVTVVHVASGPYKQFSSIGFALELVVEVGMLQPAGLRLNQHLCLVRAKGFGPLLNIAFDVVPRVLGFSFSLFKGFLFGVAGVQQDSSGSGAALVSKRVLGYVQLSSNPLNCPLCVLVASKITGFLAAA